MQDNGSWEPAMGPRKPPTALQFEASKDNLRAIHLWNPNVKALHLLDPPEMGTARLEILLLPLRRTCFWGQERKRDTEAGSEEFAAGFHFQMTKISGRRDSVDSTVMIEF